MNLFCTNSSFIATVIYYPLNTFLCLHEQIHAFIQNYNFAYGVITLATATDFIYIHRVNIIIDMHFFSIKNYIFTLFLIV